MDKEKRTLLSKLAETVGVCIVQALADLLLKKEKGEDENHERIKVLGYLIGMVRYYPARKKKYFFVPYLTRPHILRHTACSRYAEAGLDLKIIQYLMGHTDIKTTMKVYNHVDMEREQRAMKIYENWYDDMSETV